MAIAIILSMFSPSSKYNKANTLIDDGKYDEANSKEYQHWLPLFTVFLGTGCRVGELIGLYLLEE